MTATLRERLTRRPLSELPPPCGINDEDKPTSGTLARTAFRLSGIRARDDAAESDEAMTSNDNKKKARAIQRANPGMKYTEALRHTETGHVVIDLKESWNALLAQHQATGMNHRPTAGESHDSPQPYPNQPGSTSDDSPTPSDPGDQETTAPFGYTVRGGKPVFSAYPTSTDSPEPRWDPQRIAGVPTRAGKTRGRAKMFPLTLATTLDGTPVTVDLLSPQSKNLAVCGNSMAGHTTTLRALATDALSKGWQVSIVDPEHDEYRGLRLNSESVNTPWDSVPDSAPAPLDQDAVRAFIENDIKVGTPSSPRLVVIDNGDYVFRDEPGAKEGEGWMQALTRLVDDPNTAVAIQCSLPVHRTIPSSHILLQLKTRLLLGHSTEMLQSITFANHVPEKTLESFHFNQPAWRGPKADRGRGVLWNGHRLQHVRTGDWIPTTDFTPKKPITPLKDLAVGKVQETVEIEPTEAARTEWDRLNTVVGHVVGDVSPKPVFMNLQDFNGPRTGKSDDNLWVGTCATEDQATHGWNMLGQPGDRDSFASMLMSLKDNQFILKERASGRTQMIEVEAEYLAALANLRGVEE